MKVIRNLIARLLRQSVVPATPAAVVTPAPARTVRAWAAASVPRHARPATAAPDENVSPMHAAMLLSLLSTEGAAADAGSFGSCWDVPASFE
ncbi:hypothetical protein [Cupriavidus sp. BIC8F]|uniref:hypothetical protein n=1 Tax=Cupriavidus sp. BIC8F TaxID=3079014 RepID=UPI002916D171|nr:hypothetical protein [Cupriavidus sp. BIC8F]